MLRRLWWFLFGKPATFRGVGVLVHPPGVTRATVRGETVEVSNAEVADDLAEWVTNGGPGVILVLPADVDEHGNRLWDFRVEGGPDGQVKVEYRDVDKPELLPWESAGAP